MTTFKNVDEVLDFAIKAEEDAHDFYMGLSKKVEKPWMQKALVDFAREEAGHKAKLLKIKEGKTLVPAETKVLNLKLAEYIADVKPSLDMNYEQALVVAMKNEKMAYKLYMNLAQVVDDENVRNAFLALAQEEAKHKLQFETEYDDYVFQED